MRWRGWWLAIFSSVVVLYHESAENLLLFCYRISWVAFSNLRSRAMAPIQVSLREELSCLNPSGTCSTRSTMSKE
jgi:hypothetical protein